MERLIQRIKDIYEDSKQPAHNKYDMQEDLIKPIEDYTPVPAESRTKDVDTFLSNLGLEEVCDEMIKHPKSGSDYSLRLLLERFCRKH